MRSRYLNDVVHITVPKQANRKSPVKKENRDSWTETHRKKAEDRVVPRSLAHLQELVSLCHLDHPYPTLPTLMLYPDR